MAEWRIERYGAGDRRRWNEFVVASRNGTFLFDRDYMDYHADRFEDYSLMAYKGDRLLGMLPANLTRDDMTLHSHQGLTYGGWILPMSHVDGGDVLSLFEEMWRFLREEGVVALDYKPLPWFYSQIPAQEDIYALFRMGAEMTETTLSSTIDLRSPRGFNTLQRRHLRKASALGAEVVETTDTAAFWEMLASCLSERHGTRPVHSAAELELLRSRFPDNIRIFTVTLPVAHGLGADDMGELTSDSQGADGPQAGVCIFDTGRVAHSQYIATTPKGRELNLLTMLFDRLINEIFADRRYFDFGISTEEGGRVLNEGLLRQKSSLGASGTACLRFRLPL